MPFKVNVEFNSCDNTNVNNVMLHARRNIEIKTFRILIDNIEKLPPYTSNLSLLYNAITTVGSAFAFIAVTL